MTRTLIHPAENGLPALYWQPSPNFDAGKMIAHPPLAVVHDTEGGYEGAIATFANSHSQVSTQFVLKEDGSEITQMVKMADKAWHVVSFNSMAWGIEMAGFASKGFLAPEWEACARAVALLLSLGGLPPIWAQHGVGKGFCRHYDLGALGGGHQDPCAGSASDLATWSNFCAMVKTEFAKGGFPTTWGL